MNAECVSARAILKEVSLDTSVLEANRPELTTWEAIRHYADCRTCRPLGLAEIRGQALRCEEAISTAVAGKDLLYQAGNNTCTTIRDVMAHEHIYGITPIKLVRGNAVHCTPKSVLTGLVDPGMDTHPCRCAVCSEVRPIWMDAPLSAHYDGDEEAEHGTEWTIAIAEKARWNIYPLIAAAPVEKLGKFQQLLFSY